MLFGPVVAAMISWITVQAVDASRMGGGTWLRTSWIGSLTA